MPVTFPKTLGQIELNFPFKPGSHAGQPGDGPNGYGKTAVVGSLYPFGYGLSYTSFEYSDMQMDRQVATTAEAFGLSVNVKNTGNVDADEVVQIYVSPIDSESRLKPIQLQGFARVSLKAGEKQTVRFRLFPEQLGYYDGGQWNIAPGRYMVKVAASSQDIRQEQEIVLTGKHHVKKLREHYLSEVVK